jgi:hypothetical protein
MINRRAKVDKNYFSVLRTAIDDANNDSAEVFHTQKMWFLATNNVQLTAPD